MQDLYIQRIVVKHKSSLPRHCRRAPHAQFELLLNILQALLVSHLVARLREPVPPDPHEVGGDRDWDCHGEEDPQVGRCDGFAWLWVESEGIVHAEEGLMGVLVFRASELSACDKTYCYKCARQERQCQHGNGFHSCAVLPGLLCHLCCGFGEFDVQQVVSSAFLGDPARALCDLNIQFVVSLYDKVRDLGS